VVVKDVAGEVVSAVRKSEVLSAALHLKPLLRGDELCTALGLPKGGLYLVLRSPLRSSWCNYVGPVVSVIVLLSQRVQLAHPTWSKAQVLTYLQSPEGLALYQPYLKRNPSSPKKRRTDTTREFIK
jgi:hypothetical protein